LGNTIYIDDENNRTLNNISIYFINHADNHIRTKRVTPNFILRFIFANVADDEKLINAIEKRFKHDKK
jgi:hypothetical protein